MRLILYSAALLVACAAPAMAHHSFAAEFDAKQPVTLKGTVVRMVLEGAVFRFAIVYGRITLRASAEKWEPVFLS